MQRLGQALSNGNLGQARYEFEALVNDVPELGRPPCRIHSSRLWGEHCRHRTWLAREKLSRIWSMKSHA